MDAAATARGELLEEVRAAMRRLAASRPSREAHGDDAMRWLIEHGNRPDELGNAAGSVFKTSDWEFTGQWKASKRISNHSRFIRVWRLT